MDSVVFLVARYVSAWVIVYLLIRDCGNRNLESGICEEMWRASPSPDSPFPSPIPAFSLHWGVHENILKLAFVQHQCVSELSIGTEVVLTCGHLEWNKPSY